MAANSLSDAFNVCAAQVARGRSIDDVIAQYPQFADDLRLLLTVSSAVARYELPSAEVDAARVRVQPTIDDLIDGFPNRGLPPWIIPLVIVVAIAIIALILAAQPGGIFSAAPTLTPTASPTTVPSLTVIATSTTSATATASSTPTPSPTLTQTPTLTPSPTATVNVCAQTVVLEGLIEAIQGNQLVIYGISVVVSDVSRYAVGMLVRVEGCTCADDACHDIGEASVIIPTTPPIILPTSVPNSGGSGTGAGDDDSSGGGGQSSGGGQPPDDDDDDDGVDDDGGADD